MFNKIITICTGNICRSPAAEFLLRQRLEAVASWQGSVHSAGIGALVNHPADENTQAMMLAKDIDLSAHRAKQLTLEHLRQADLVLVMEKHHRQAVLDLDPTARGKTFLLGHWINTEIPDPYRRGEEAHAEALRLIELAISPWLEKL
ncbi:MAG: low molecular weight phosphotyrosine protein phosphatase [Betaproteobacteria bacterium]|nr:low molecular weight phosphotyrosine protein phosphatase [Betaproteobacteria bacterium]MBK9785780.1 low molecular weight phosphotyrosine protein phosphatase [Candidatus Dechloromonas phosphorivorans]